MPIGARSPHVFALIAVCRSCAGAAVRGRIGRPEEVGRRITCRPLVELYRHLHQTPELSQKEKETSARMAKELRDIGVKVTTNVGGYGVVGVLENGPGKVAAAAFRYGRLARRRANRPAVRVESAHDDPHGATVGVMHACGHDVHMTNLVGVARYLASHRDQWSGTIVFMFQPAEETSGGAEAMLNDGLLSRFPRPDFAVALHDSADVADRQDQLPPRLLAGQCR